MRPEDMATIFPLGMAGPSPWVPRPEPGEDPGDGFAEPAARPAARRVAAGPGLCALLREAMGAAG